MSTEKMQLWGEQVPMTSRYLLGSNQDFIVGLLRSQVRELSRLLTTIEESNAVDEYVPELSQTGRGEHPGFKEIMFG